MARNPYIENYEAEQAVNEKEMAKTRRTVNRNANRMMNRAHQPTAVTSFFDGVYKQSEKTMDTPNQDPDGFVQTVEEAYLNNRGNVPMPWLIAQDPKDVALMTPEVARELYETQDDMLYHAQVEADIKAQTEQRIRSRARLRSFVQPQTLAENAFSLLVGQGFSGSEVDMSTVAAEERAQIEQDVRNEILGTGVTATSSAQRSWTDALFGVAGFIFGSEKVMQAGQSVFGVVTEGVVRGLGTLTGVGPAMEQAHQLNLFGMQDRWRAEQDAAVAAAQAEADLPTSELVERLRGQTYITAYNQLKETDPQTYQDILDMADGNVALGFAFFSDIMDNNIDVQDQMRQMVEDPEQGYRRDLLEFTDTVRENNYSFTDSVLEGLSTYKLPYQLATTFTLFLTDDEVRQKTVDDGWHNMWEEVAKNDNSPARVLGLENTAVGMLFDIGAGIAFDPSTWIFGPRMMGMLGRAASKTGAWALRRSPIVQASMDDAVRLSFSNAAGTSQVVHTLGYLDDTGDLGAALEVLGGVDRTLPGRPYLRSDARALYTEEVSLTNAMRVLDPEDLARFDSLNVDNLATSITNKGFDGALEMTYSVRDGTMHLTDGLKRLRAAQQLGLRNVPVTIRMTDTLRRTAQTAARQLTPDDNMVRAMAQIEQGSQSFAFHFSDDLTPQLAEDIVAGRQRFNAGGITTDRAKGLATQTTGGDPVMLVFDQATMDPVVQEALRTGDITDIRRVRAANPQPVGWVRLSEFDELARESLATVTDNAPREFRPAITTTEGPAGVPLEGLWGDAEMPALPKALEEGVTNVRPSAVLPKEFVLGQDAVAAREALEKIVERAINNGATPASIYNTPVARFWNGRIKEAARRLPGTDWLRRYMTPQNTIQRFEYYGANATRRITDTIMRMWGDDTAKIDHYLDLVYDHRRRQAAGNAAYVDDLARLEPDILEVRALQDLQGGGWDDSARFLDEQLQDARAADAEGAATLADEWEQAKANRRQVHEELVQKNRAVSNELARMDAARAMSLPGGREMTKILQSMWDDFNRTHIATKKGWAEFVDPETGIVPWEQLRRGRPTAEARAPHEGARQFLPAEMQQIGKELGIPAEQLSQQLVDVLHEEMAFNAPLSPLELLIASETSGARFIKLSQQFYAGQIREGYHALQSWWIKDKVMQPATAMTVSFDELQRFFHIGGAEAIARWGRARADFIAARAAALRHRRLSTSAGASHLSAKAQARIQAVTDMHTRYAQAERQTLDGMGLGWDDISPGQPGYMDAARRWTGDTLQSSSFRAYLRGPEEFQKWFTSPDGLQMRNATVLRNGTANLLNSWEEAYKGWQTIFERVMLKKAADDGVFDEVMQAFRDTAAKIDASGGQPHNLPVMVFEHLGPVRGIRRDLTMKNAVPRATDYFFEKTFMDPVNFRRGVVADMARAVERTRLVRLFTDQGRRILSEAEIQNMDALRGFSGTRPGLRQLRDQKIMEMGPVPESYIDDLADMRAMEEVDNLLYTWDQGSRMGQQMKNVFPFGRPWADMAAFWGREVLTRPALRGVLAKSSWANSLVDALPFNPKPLAMISRLAQTDMSFQELWPGQELPFGAEEANLSPLLFLPTNGENPLGSLLPGLGFIPVWFMDRLLTTLHDPAKDPLAYQQLVDDVSQVFPSAAYTRGGIVSDFLGGGVRGRTLGVLSDVMAWQTGRSFFNSASLLGDISRETANTRELSVLLADPDVLAELMALEDPEEIKIHLQGLVLQAVQNAAGSNIAGNLTRAFTPIRAEYDSTAGELQDVWMSAAEQFPELRPTREYDLSTDDGKRQAADHVRRLFFDLPQWQRDLFVTQNPALAVNLVGSWEWTEKAADDLGFDVTASYRTTSLPGDLARHQLYIDRGYVRPLNLLVRTQRILALMQDAKEQSARRMYEFTAEDINEEIWNTVVSDDTKAFLTQIASSEFGAEFGYQTAREVWERWGTAEGDFERWVATQDRIPTGTEQYKGLTDAVSVPSAERGWGRSFPGTDEMELSARFRDVPLTRFRPEVVQIAEGLGIELTPGMTGEQFYRGIQEVLTTRETPLWGMVESVYDQYVNDRSVAGAQAETELREVTRNPNLSEDYRSQANAFFRYVYNLEHRMSEGNRQPQPSLAEQEEVARRYQALRANGQGLSYDWEGGWKTRFERNYGPLEWTPPEPAPVFMPDGEQNPNAYQPYIQHIVDGDTMIVSDRIGPARLFGGPVQNAQPRVHHVRLLGLFAPEFNAEGGQQSREKLEDALMEALRNGDKIWLVRDPDTFGGATDAYGRELAWLWIGDTPYHDPSTLQRESVPSGGEG